MVTGVRCKFPKSYPWIIHLLFYEKLEDSVKLKTIEEMTVLRPWCCLSLGVILLCLTLAALRGFRPFDCVSFALFFISLCTDALFSVVLRCRNVLGKCEWSSDEKDGSQDDFFEALACTEHDVVLWSSKQIRPEFHGQMFCVAVLSLLRSKNEKWGTRTYLWFFP